jgi:hypothetical protein
MRLGMPGLALRVQQFLGRDPMLVMFLSFVADAAIW